MEMDGSTGRRNFLGHASGADQSARVGGNKARAAMQHRSQLSYMRPVVGGRAAANAHPAPSFSLSRRALPVCSALAAANCAPAPEPGRPGWRGERRRRAQADFADVHRAASRRHERCRVCARASGQRVCRRAVRVWVCLCATWSAPLRSEPGPHLPGDKAVSGSLGC